MKESIKMHSKVIFFVLFMLSFTVAHDTVIKIIQPNGHNSIAHYIDENIQSQECNGDSIDEIHGMFHFVALVAPYRNRFIQPSTKQTLTHNSFTYTFTYKETSDKPPKA